MARQQCWYFGLFAVVAVGLVALAPGPHHSPAPHAPAREAQIRDLNIEFYHERAARDPLGARDLMMLATLYLQRARETGSNEDLVRAETAANRSAAHRLNRNAAALQVLASSQLGQHKFGEASQTARRLVELDPERVSYRALLAETLMELGQYDKARAAFIALSGHAGDLSVAPRLARWVELQGRPEEAHRLLLGARDRAVRVYGITNEQLAWFNLRLGDLALRYGRLGEAQAAYAAGLQSSPDDYRLFTSLARLKAVRHDWRAAIANGEQAIETALDPATLGLLGDAHAALGDSAKTKEYYRVMEVAVLGQPGALHRAWSHFLLDHGWQIPEVLARAEQDVKTRKDIYGYDLLAWALLRAGRPEEAEHAMGQALRLGTQDASLFFHAGIIERRLGHTEAARRYLIRALDTNPSFDPVHPAVARAILDSLAREQQDQQSAAQDRRHPRAPRAG